MVVGLSTPILEGAQQLKGTGPLLPPEALLFEGAHEAFRIRVALGIIIARINLIPPKTSVKEVTLGLVAPC
jgi:hypothetical protein